MDYVMRKILRHNEGLRSQCGAHEFLVLA